MQIQDNNPIFELSPRDTARFRKIVLDMLCKSCKMPEEDESDYDGIGTLAEKQMHAAIKRFICPDESCHEIKIDGSALCINREEDDENNKKKKRRFVADVLKENTIFEIQTGSFGPLKEKIAWILENTTYNIAVIHPIIETKWINYINDKTCEIESRHKSPQKEKFTDIASDLHYFRDFINNPRFSLVLLVMEAEQYKKNTAKDKHRRPRYRKYELIPVSLLRAYVFKNVRDYNIFIPDDLEEPFTVKNYSLKSKIYGMDAYSIVKTLVYVGLLEESGKLGRAVAYKRKNEV